ncbi:hypothetical protein ACH41E_08605 [Streptomyces sp. NPDC020412]|uniref:hypothetical protein n=1 Tax=Streptomyces sp. NPDC020412 TaxID=3365073 RepID=UPI0037B44D7A
MVVGMVLLAGCEGSAEEGKPETKASEALKVPPLPSPLVKTGEQVVDDFEFAVQGLAEARTTVMEEREDGSPCGVAAVGFTKAVAGISDAQLVVDRLVRRGWRDGGDMPADGGTVRVAQAGESRIFVTGSAVPEEFTAQAGANKGVVTFQWMARCGPEEEIAPEDGPPPKPQWD